MQSELPRIVAGLPVAALWPLTVPQLAASRMRVGGAAFFSALYILAPQLPDLISILLLLATTAIPVFLWVADGQAADPVNPSPKQHLSTYGPVAAAILLGGAAVAAVDANQGWDAIETAIDSDGVALTATGLIATVFVGGTWVAWILRPFTQILGQSEAAARLQGLTYAGRYIGWFERAILFGFVIGGQPEAAAVALAAKSFARFPTLSEHQRGFVEYFLIGSLASLTIAVALAAGTRAAVGMAPF